MIKNRPSGSATIADGSITEAKLDASLIALINAGGGSVAEGSITSFHIATGSILGTDISGATITGSNIAVATITSSNITDGTILGTDISNNTITGSNIAEGTITSSNIADGTILGTDISNNTITGSNIAEGTITSSNIADGTITTADISDGAITEAKFSPALQLALVTFSQQLYNLQYPGFWGNLRIINDNSSDQGATMTITIQSEYYDAPTNNTDIIGRLKSTTITKGSHIDIPITIDDRLTNKDTILRMYYTINKNDIVVVSNNIVQEDDKGSDVNGDYFVLIFSGSYADMNGGNAEIGFTIADNI